MSAEVRAVGIRKAFRQGKQEQPPVLAGVDVVAPAGKITTILGESGCGKTTLLRIVAGLETPSDGRVLIGGRGGTKVPPPRREVAMVFQNYGLYPAKTVQRNIEFPLKMAGVSRPERRVRAERVARILHIEHLLDRLPAELSGGQRQRVGICRALARDPEILLMDEPLSNLDAQLRIEMRGELVSLQRTVGSTMLYVTHDQVEAMTMSDVVVVMRGGLVEQTGSALEVFSKPATSYVASFLGNMNVVPLGDASGILRLPAEVAVRPGDAVGVRPEHLRLVEDAAEPALVEGRVVLSELHGTDRVLHVRAGESTWRARVDSSLAYGETVRLAAAPGSVHVFDSEGRRRAA